MKLKSLLFICISFFFGNVLFAQDTIVVNSVRDIIKVVNRANSTLNGIYKERCQGYENRNRQLDKSIYSANEVLFDLREIIFDQSNLQPEKVKKVSAEVNALSYSTFSLRKDLSDEDCLIAISDVKSKAKVLIGQLRRLNK